MTKRSTRHVTGFLICIAAATVTVSAGSSRVTRGRIGEAATVERGKGNGAPFLAMQPCKAGDDAKLRFVSGRNPFHGGGAHSAYGDIFFASSGGSSVQQSSGISAAAETKMATIVSAPAPTIQAAAAPGRAIAAAAIAATPAMATAPAVTTTAAVVPAAGGAAASPAVVIGPMTSDGPPPLPTLPATPSASNPEPASILLIGMGLSAIGLARKRSRRSDKA